jgi:hypothetical protein
MQRRVTSAYVAQLDGLRLAFSPAGQAPDTQPGGRTVDLCAPHRLTVKRVRVSGEFLRGRQIAHAVEALQFRSAGAGYPFEGAGAARIVCRERVGQAGMGEIRPKS